MAPIRPLHDPAAVDGAVEDAVAVLRRGGVVALPTDTVYGIAALPSVAGATSKLFAAKGRRADVPVAVLCADASQALSLVADGAVGSDARQVLDRFWPGGLTVVLPRRAGLGYELGEPATTIGLRCPNEPVVRAIAALVGPLATTSANRHGAPTPHDASGVVGALGDDLDLVLDGGERRGAPSTVVDMTTRPWRIVRAGAVDPAALVVVDETGE